MKKELDSYLVAKYPKILINRYKDIKESSMGFGIQTNDGWFWLIDQLFNSIQHHIDSNEYRKKDEQVPQVVMNCVKEKFGILDISCNNSDDYIEGMISLAENMSINICEFCGSTKHVGRTSGWIYTICEKCYNKAIKDKNIRIASLPWKENKSEFENNFKAIRKIKIDKLEIESESTNNKNI
jgi:hypothetical protein